MFCSLVCLVRTNQQQPSSIETCYQINKLQLIQQTLNMLVFSPGDSDAQHQVTNEKLQLNVFFTDFLLMTVGIGAW